jgi:hypothetical protein
MRKTAAKKKKTETKRKTGKGKLSLLFLNEHG